ncbi:MAG: hypothetical protein J4G12_06295 [Gemmatimonadetes bacterium]|nr:hypothetical protein [Gemmatimonadota bacterium]
MAEPLSGPPPDQTLGGYLELHKRPPAFGSAEGNHYTVEVEVERTGDLRAPYSGYLVFPRWAATGIGIVGHLETPILAHSRSEAGVRAAIGALSLHEVRAHLERALAEHGNES